MRVRAAGVPESWDTDPSLVIERGSGQFDVVDPPTPPPPGERTGRVVRYTIEVERGLGIDRATYAAFVQATLVEPRGWERVDGIRFVNVTRAQAAAGARVDQRVLLASPATTDRLCAPLKTHGEINCHQGGTSVVNLRRWVTNTPAYQGGGLVPYRSYIVNHEMGHGLGHGHIECAGPGRPAALMTPQTYRIGSCTAWPWPEPPASR